MKALRTVLVALLSLLALPAAASAAANWSTSSVSSPGPFTSGELVTVTLDIVNTGDAGPTAGSITIRDGEWSTLVIEGTPVVTDGPGPGTDRSAQVTPALDSPTVDIAAGFTTGDARVTFQVRLRKDFDPELRLTGQGLSGTFNVSEPGAHIVSKGGPSQLVVDRVGTPQPFVVAKDAAPVVTFRITNRGTGPAQLLKVSRSVSGSVDSLFSTTPPAYSPTATFTSGCVAVVDAGDGCELADLAAGASVDVVMTLGGLTHYGSASVYLYVETSSENGDNVPTRSIYLKVGDGTSAYTSAFMRGPETAAGNTDLTYTGTFKANGTTPIGSSIAVIKATAFDSEGRQTSSRVQRDSIKSITLSNGATCSKYVDTTVTPSVTWPNEWHCPFASLPAGATLTATIVANFPTARRNVDVSMDMEIESLTELSTGSTERSTTLNIDRTATLEIAGSGPKVVGADRIASITVSAKNTGNTNVVGAGAGLRVSPTVGEILVDDLPAGCSASWSQGTMYCWQTSPLAPGASVSWTVRVHVTRTLGFVGMLVTPSEWGSELADAYSGEWSALDRIVTMQVVKPSEVPFLGVKVAKAKAQSTAQLAKSGASTTVTCPSACKARVELRLNRATAVKLGWAKKPKGKAAKKALPYVVIGSGTASSTTAGKVVVKSKLTKPFKNKAAKLTSALVVQSSLTVSSTSADTKDASFAKLTNQTFKPAKKHKR